MPPNKTTRMTESLPRLRQRIQSILEKFPEHLWANFYRRQVEGTLPSWDDILAAESAKIDAVFLPVRTLTDIRKHSRTEAGRQATNVIRRHRQQTPKLDHIIESPRHLEETVRRRTTLVDAEKQATNVICTNIKSQRHIEQAGRRKRSLTMLGDELKRQLDTAIDSGRTLAPGVNINIIREEGQRIMNRSIPPLENRSVRFNNSYYPSRTSPRRKVKRLPDDVQRQYHGMWYTAANRACFQQKDSNGINIIYMGKGQAQPRPTKETVAADRKWNQHVRHCNKLRQEMTDHERNARDRDAEIIDGVTYGWKPGNVA